MRRSLIASLLLAGISVATVAAQTTVVYNSIPKPLPGNVASEGPEAYSFAELGDGLSLQAAGGGTIGQVNVVLSSWACQTGNWSDGSCVTAAGATFSQPITVNLYAVTDQPGISGGMVLAKGALIGTLTQTFNIPYRPSVSASCGDNSAWYSSKEKACYHGLAVPISVNFSTLHIPVPTDNRLIVTVTYNTSHFGKTPVGSTACNSTSAGCPYDSLNIATDSSIPVVAPVGNPLDTNGLFINYTSNYFACQAGTQTGILVLDTGCWAGYHPQISVAVNANGTAGGKKIKP